VERVESRRRRDEERRRRNTKTNFSLSFSLPFCHSRESGNPGVKNKKDKMLFPFPWE